MKSRRECLETLPDAILAAGGGANEIAHAFKRLTSTVPIVMANSSDPSRRVLSPVDA
jgi:putative tryptophan/tyrosine transport system substrate-binding protein